MTTFLVTAAYREVIDQPQVYETTVGADSPEEAEQVAQDQCRDDNGMEPDDPNPLIDVYVRPLAEPEQIVRFVLDFMGDEHDEDVRVNGMDDRNITRCAGQLAQAFPNMEGVAT
jgi:hypothetical protein